AAGGRAGQDGGAGAARHQFRVQLLRRHRGHEARPGGGPRVRGGNHPPGRAARRVRHAVRHPRVRPLQSVSLLSARADGGPLTARRRPARGRRPGGPRKALLQRRPPSGRRFLISARGAFGGGNLVKNLRLVTLLWIRGPRSVTLDKDYGARAREASQWKYMTSPS